MNAFDWIMVALAIIFVIYALFYLIKHSIRCVSEREHIIVERLGKYSKSLSPGVNMLVPFLDRTKFIYSRYVISSRYSRGKLIETYSDVISTQNEVIDFPEQ